MTQRLVDGVIASGGVMRVPVNRWNDTNGIDYEQLVDLAKRYRNVPSGKRLISTRTGDDLEISLIDVPEADPAPVLAPIEMPERIGRYHLLARAFRDQTGRHDVSRNELRRATTIIHVIAVEAELRGRTVAIPPDRKNDYGHLTWAGGRDGHITIESHGHIYRIRLHEAGVHARGPWGGRDEAATRVVTDVAVRAS